MPSIALQFPSGRGTWGGGFLQSAGRAARLADLVVAVIAEARESAASYRELSLLSDAELRKRGLARETIARFAVLGRAN